jgi:hypothetical protein
MIDDLIIDVAIDDWPIASILNQWINIESMEHSSMNRSILKSSIIDAQM